MAPQTPLESGINTPNTHIHPTAARNDTPIVVESEKTVYTDEYITSTYDYHTQTVINDNGVFKVTPKVQTYQFRTQRKVPRMGLMMVGLGGNNGTTLTATILANKHNIHWHTKEGLQTPNYIGSILRASTLRLGVDPSTGSDVHVPLSSVLPTVHPNDLVIGGWDISSLPLDQAMQRAQVLQYDLQRQIAPLMASIRPLPSIYYPDFIAANQEERADNLIPGKDKQAHLEQIRKDIREFKQSNSLDSVVVFWTANTERYSEILPGVNDTAANLLKAIEQSHEEVSPSTLFAVASILEGAPFINGAPQNTFVPGCIQLAEEHQSFIGGDDLKSGQTKVKSVLAEFLVNAGIKPLSIASYNHLGNNDGRNLSAEAQFKSKEISKSSVVDDMVGANHLLYKPKGEGEKKGEHPNHLVVIKYMPAVGDSKRAIDEYYSEICMGGRSVINIFNECEDSLLASPLILDLSILAELLTRISYRCVDANGQGGEFKPLYTVLSLLSYMLKAPLVKPGTDVVNALGRQRNALELFLKACLGLEGQGDLLLETRVW
ncbi:Inositol-3-phosphate synthase; AltName: Full=Myo-inositol 1-phosphate synthase; Short=IPS; Short=MI-1-P synthase; Short=MIP synthase [Serendipita indica DSM 11827]|uniref:Inositol-3-phosphate synthase n=1 Tax=Serendipita indica (strain DSM 11827) TaxID=1109443 RepID=G4TNT9_SERID|nr:Inositol-3-phosphate synthase; AltName: Full=Myo-inositol 1-phosphate synthase; Short=IPS; Short=MI-1-P synthase; Short=MIP synthase [Serendipita indica DSM 11827]CCA72987.1 probable myo-inositol 1-phosphate synthase (MIPS) [Serendipita indica DSM 11827]